MKKFFALCFALMFAALMVVSFCATASAALTRKTSTTVLSPVATTVDSDNDNTKRTRKFHRETTTYADSRDDPNSPDYTGKGGKRTTKNYGDNEGRDDPNSPNYTGNRTPSSDNSSHSPDTAASSSVVCVAALAVCSAITVGALSCKKKD